MSKKRIKSSFKKETIRFLKTKQGRVIFAIFTILFGIWILIPEKTNALSEDIKQSRNVVKDIEIPEITDRDQIIRHMAYTLSYDEENEQPFWVAYRIERDKLTHPIASRTDDFREDYSVKTGSAIDSDYKNSGYDRGHLAPAADFKWDKKAMSESFYFSNMSPQKPEFNRGIWENLESAVRSNAYNEGVLYITTGPIWNKNNKNREYIGNSKVGIPDGYYKVLLSFDDKGCAKTIGFILPNEGSNKHISKFATSVDKVEEETGINFFPKIGEEAESNYDIREWTYSPYKGFDTVKIEGNKPIKADSFYRTKIELLELKRMIRKILRLSN